MNEFKLGMVLPGENLLVAIFNYATKVRETMSPENRDKFDSLNIKMLEDWRRLWVTLKILPE